MTLKVSLISLIIFIGSSFAQAQAQRFGGTNMNMRGMSGYMGFGVAEFTLLNPASEFRMDSGTQVYVAGEKEIGKTGFFITISMSFMQNKGQSFYDYTTLGGTNYATNPGTQIDFTAEHLHLGMGLKFKIFPTSFFRPYGEGGGLFSYHGMNYRPQQGQLTNSDGGQRNEDGLIGFGYYMEAGIEVDFSELWGVRVGARYLVSDTRPFETLGNQQVKYEARIFQFGIGRKF
jgi:hypothetical protein